LAQLPSPAAPKGASRIDYTLWKWQKTPPAVLGQVGKIITFAGVGLIGFLVVAILLGL
jgi:hypothetical protein